jgi:alpha-tubulin suppressor-like RCC1 family protein
MEIDKPERSESLGVPVPIVYSWGRSDFGSLFRKPGDDDIDGVFQFESTRTIMQMSSNVYHSAAVTSTGELYTCGENYDGQVAPKCAGAADDENEHKRPRILDILGGQQRITSVSCGLTHTVCVTATGLAITLGGNECGQLGHTPNTITNVPPKMVVFHTHHQGLAAGSGVLIRKAAAGDLFSLFLTTSGEVYGCGSASYLGNPIVGDGSRANVTSAQRVEPLTGTHIMDLVAGSSHVLALTGSGEVFGWGDNIHCQLGFNSRSNEASNITSAAAGNSSTAGTVSRSTCYLLYLSLRISRFS